jgi:RNA recognition motif-containing protein
MEDCFMNMYIGNLAHDVTENDLRNAFSEFGEVSSVKIITDKFSGRSKGFGFVEMPDNSEADQAIKALNGKVLNGRSIKVNQAEPRGKRPQRRRRY